MIYHNHKCKSDDLYCTNSVLLKFFISFLLPLPPVWFKFTPNQEAYKNSKNNEPPIFLNKQHNCAQYINENYDCQFHCYCEAQNISIF